jgi:hypothetical protein
LRSLGDRRGPTCPDIPGANQVGSGRIAAIDTGERPLRLTIGPVDRPTQRTSSAGVAWIDGTNRHAFKRRPRNSRTGEVEQRTARAAVGWRPCGLNRLADGRQVLDRISRCGSVRCSQQSAWRYTGSRAFLKRAFFPRSFFKRCFYCHDVAGRHGEEFLPDAFDVGAITQALTGRGAGRNREVEFVAGMPPHTPTRS